MFFFGLETSVNLSTDVVEMLLDMRSIPHNSLFESIYHNRAFSETNTPNQCRQRHNNQPSLQWEWEERTEKLTSFWGRYLPLLLQIIMLVVVLIAAWLGT